MSVNIPTYQLFGVFNAEMHEEYKDFVKNLELCKSEAEIDGLVTEVRAILGTVGRLSDNLLGEAESYSLRRVYESLEQNIDEKAEERRILV